MKQKKNSKTKSSGSKTGQNHNQGGTFKEPKAVPSNSKSYGTKEQFYNPGNSVTHNSNENPWTRSRHSSVSDMWSDTDEHFPVLGASAATMPKKNVWEERKSKQEEVKALEPQSEYDEQAMLQRALALSILEAQEEERQKKMEEDYKIQLEALQCFSKDVEDLNAPEESVEEESSKFQNFPVKEQRYLENCSRNSVPSNNQKEKSCNSGGARPKINKAIEAFGGWGLKDDKIKNNSENISEFVEDVISEKSSGWDSYNKISNNQKCQSNNTKENYNSSKGNSWHSTAVENGRTSSTIKSENKREFLYDKKGAFVDDDDGIWGNYQNEAANQPRVSPNKVLDEWLDSEDDDYENGISNGKKVPNLTDTKTDDYISAPLFNDKPKIEDDKDKNLPTPIEFSIPSPTCDYEPKHVKDSQTLLQKTCESSRNIWSNTTNYKEQELPENKDGYNCDANDQSVNNFTPFHEPTEVPTLTSSNIWSDKSSNSSSYFSSLSENLSNKLESVKIGKDDANEVFSVDSSSNESDVPPIPPPQPPTAVTTIDDYNTSATPNTDCNAEPPCIPPPQPFPEMPVPQFPMIGNPMLNPMLPGLNPMMGYAMDPLMMRQMLILSNPFLANQLLAMEQYYRSMGIPVDLFSMSSPMPNIAGFMNPPLLPNMFANNVNDNIQQLQSEIQQLQTQIEVGATVSRNAVETYEEKSFEKSHEPSELDSVQGFKNTSTSEENCNRESWFGSYLSSDNTVVIPPPVPPSNEVNCTNSIPVPQKIEPNHIASSYDNEFALPSDISTIHLSNTKKERPLTAFDACSTKIESTGWSDPEDDVEESQDFKRQTWDDGWGDGMAPPRPHRNPLLHEDRKRTVFRQPAKQPQISRYQRSFTNS